MYPRHGVKGSGSHAMSLRICGYYHNHHDFRGRMRAQTTHPSRNNHAQGRIRGVVGVVSAM